MAFAPPTKNKLPSTNIAKSTWTPMNNSEANKEVFEERRIIIKKWFEKWHDKQRRIVLEDIFKSLSEKHLKTVYEELQKKFPEERHDFTKRLPRVLSLYIFSFLDPRSLSRCAQVSWYWKYLTELDCLWKPKCLKFGWYPTHQPSRYEETVWKRYYISTIYKLHYAKVPNQEQGKSEEEDIAGLNTARTDRTHLSTSRSQLSIHSTSRRKKATVAPKNVPIPGPKWEPPPWRGSDPHPADTVRYNYFDNKTTPKNKHKSSQRPKSASGSVIMSAKQSERSPLKSSGTPRPSSSTSNGKKSVVTQSLDPRSLRSNGSVNGDIPVATSRNMMSTSVSNFSYTGSQTLYETGNKTLPASTYHIPAEKSFNGTSSLDLHGSPEQSMRMPEMSPNSKNASMRPKPVVSLSTHKNKSVCQEPKKKVEEKPANDATPFIEKPVASASNYKEKDSTSLSGKSSPLKGNPWQTKEVASDDSDF